MQNPTRENHRQKIRTIMSIAETFLKYQHNYTDKTAVLVKEMRHLFNEKPYSGDKWFIDMFNSFFKAAIQNKPIPEWMAACFQNLGIVDVASVHKADQIFDEFRPGFDINATEQRCVDFLYAFLHEQTLPALPETGIIADEAIGNLVRSSERSCDESCHAGDILTYQNAHGKFMHVGIILGEAGGKTYAISKFGMHGTFLHPLDGVPEHYGTANIFVNKGISKSAQEKLTVLQRQVTHILNPDSQAAHPIKEKPCVTESSSTTKSETVLSAETPITIGFFSQKPKSGSDNQTEASLESTAQLPC